MKKKQIYFLLFTLGLMCSCKKDNDKCQPTKNADINYDRLKIYTGSTLTLSASIPNLFSYEWSGPGGWTSSEKIPSRKNMQPADAGYYYFKAFDINNCIVYSGSKFISVHTIPDVPCTIVNHTISSNSAILGNYIFPYPGGIYTILNTSKSIFSYRGYINQNKMIYINFSGSTYPFSGIYKTFSNDYYFPTRDHVNITITTPTNKFYSKTGMDLYVNTISGRQVVSFCNLPMVSSINPSSTTEFYITGKLFPY